MNSETQLWLFAMSVGASAFGGMLGMASGIFIVPILTIFGHIGIRSDSNQFPARALWDRTIRSLGLLPPFSARK
jgi:uncharacterized membrane protein YfcA